ncbi:hypothetical protein EKB06_07205 [Streptococcus pseudopneumoniae]|uniref:hypothetical protein n=1 Tax=Streptococcus pseudopneumoniae TaxID=257758 RepID=UPI0014199F03|nr:hypothetical protein [Streptococcus pseudopneumoniae]NIB78901.1 hypothetical protein [Streptococcus pseudopneumoniae]
MEVFLYVVIVSAITSFLVTVMLLRGYSYRLTEMLENFFDNELQARKEIQKLTLDTMDRIANKK